MDTKGTRLTIRMCPTLIAISSQDIFSRIQKLDIMSTHSNPEVKENSLMKNKKVRKYGGCPGCFP